MRWQARDKKAWQRFFALLPRKVGDTWVWLERYERRGPSHSYEHRLCETALERNERILRGITVDSNGMAFGRLRQEQEDELMAQLRLTVRKKLDELPMMKAGETLTVSAKINIT